MNSIIVGSLNMRGLGDIHQRREICTWLREKKHNIFLLQETKCTKDKEALWEREWGAKCIFNSSRRAAQGVCILFQNNFEFEIINVFKNHSGIYIIVHLKISGLHELLVLINLYGPNIDD